ncbi:MAG: acyl-CoA dehydrogenase family protein [Burkholderiales bacterium]
MKFELNDDQRMLSDSVQTWLGKEYGHEAWRAISLSPARWSSKVWAQFAEMGWLSAPLAEAHGGLGGGTVESFVIGEAFGSALVLEPYLSSVVIGAGLIAQAGTAEQAAEYLPRIAEGQLKTAFAFAEAQSRFELHDVQTRADKRDGAYVLSGSKVTVWDAPDADLLIVLARTAGGRLDEQGLGLFLVARDAPGVSLSSFPMMDRRAGAHIRFDGARAQAVLGDGESALGAVRGVVDQALVYLAAEACGAMRAANAITLDYIKQRKQFGQALAEFQVLRHRMVDMTVQTECSYSLALHAALTGSGAAAGSAELAKVAAAAKVQTGRAGRWVGHQGIQLHGGMGMTDDMAIGHYMKRLVMIDTAFGNADHHQRRFAQLTRTAAA